MKAGSTGLRGEARRDPRPRNPAGEGAGAPTPRPAVLSEPPPRHPARHAVT